jgi:hypothetical protein
VYSLHIASESVHRIGQMNYRMISEVDVLVLNLNNKENKMVMYMHMENMNNNRSWFSRTYLSSNNLICAFFRLSCVIDVALLILFVYLHVRYKEKKNKNENNKEQLLEANRCIDKKKEKEQH